MKKVPFLALAVGAVGVVASPASAGGLHIYGSYWDVDDLGDTAGGGLMLAIPLGAAQRINLDLGATYYQQFESDDFFDRLIDDRESPFLRNGVDVIPLDIGVSFAAAPRAPFNLTLGGGATYFLLDTDRGEVDDEAGWYGRVGAEFGGGGGGLGFFVAGIYRSAEAKVQNDPDDFRDIPDIEFESETPFEGIGDCFGRLSVPGRSRAAERAPGCDFRAHRAARAVDRGAYTPGPDLVVAPGELSRAWGRALQPWGEAPPRPPLSQCRLRPEGRRRSPAAA